MLKLTLLHFLINCVLGLGVRVIRLGSGHGWVCLVPLSINLVFMSFMLHNSGFDQPVNISYRKLFWCFNLLSEFFYVKIYHFKRNCYIIPISYC